MKPLYFLLVVFSLIITPLQAKNIVVIGDSLSAGYGINPKNGWVNLLSVQLASQGQFNVINLSTSGDTTSNGLSKLPDALNHYKPDILIIELGANDGLRGLAINQMKNNLEAMVQKGKQARAKILLLETALPPNYGPEYLKQFKGVYQDLETRYQVTLVPMFLQGVAGQDSLMQSDGLHPNEKAQPIILNNIWPALKLLL
jgi:acyl-CoA thioesterase-1